MNTDLQAQVAAIFARLDVGLSPAEDAALLHSRTPLDGSLLAHVAQTPPAEMEASVRRLQARQRDWAAWPAPRRGELLRRWGLLLREHKPDLGLLVTLETGKILQEGLGEVQEMIDICDYATGLSRQLFGRVIASERPEHKMRESWQPYGVCGVISAFNFPVAVWAWNAAIALACGNALVWKPSHRTPLCALAVHGLLRRVLAGSDPDWSDVSALWLGRSEAGRLLAAHPGIRLVSATGSTAMGREVALACAAGFKRTILELGGNNAALVCASADLNLALRAVLFAAVGTAGQRCTTLRRAFVHESVYGPFVARLRQAWAGVAVGDPREPATLVGPLIDGAAFDAMQRALAECRALGNRVTGGERLLQQRFPGAHYVRPALVETEVQHALMLRETFAPILYLCPFTELDEAIALNNAASHGLSSCIFTDSLREAERFTSELGSDCGIVNVNLGTSGAEIGGAFGGEKDSGGGRESGSDAWKSYMRRVTSTVNWGRDLPLAQGIRFES
ncbi:MAG: putative exported protein [Pseudomonadota bacterium]